MSCRDEDCGQLFALAEKGRYPLCRKQTFVNDELHPEARLIHFFYYDAQLGNKRRSRLCHAGGPVIGSRSSRTSNQLRSNVAPEDSVRQSESQLDTSVGKLLDPLHQLLSVHVFIPPQDKT